MNAALPNELGYELGLRDRWHKTADRQTGDGTYVVGEVCIHNNHKVSSAEIETMDVCGPVSH